jgi:REP element-mobilizing transposase RayT
MSQSLSSIKVHLVFSTKSRLPWLTDDIRGECHHYLAGVAHNCGSQVHEIGGISDHVHLLLTLPKTVALSKMVEMLKTSSSKWLKSKNNRMQQFAWQSGYGAFSVSESQTERVRRYIQDQERHHRVAGYQKEFLSMLQASRVTYDEKYLWD